MVQQSKCSLAGCEKAGAARCSRCKTWYCSRGCQEDHWPQHLRLCYPVPALEWMEVEDTSRNDSTNSGNTVRAGTVTAEELLKEHVVVTDVSGTVKAVEKMEINPGTATNAQLMEENNNSAGESVSNMSEKEPRVCTESKVDQTNTVVDQVEKMEQGRKRKADHSINTKVEKEGRDGVEDHVEKIESRDKANVEKIESRDKTNVDQVEKIEPEGRDKVDKATKDGEKGEKQYKEAFSSPMMLMDQEIPRELAEIIVSNAVTPSEFYFRLAASSELYTQLVELMQDMAPPEDSGWCVGRKEPLLALHLDLWQRGLAVRRERSTMEYDVFLLDTGETISVKRENLRPLPVELKQIPPFVFQDGGKFTLKENDDFYALVTDSEYPLMVEFLGQLSGGRWLVKLQGKDDKEDLSKQVVEANLFSATEDPPMISGSEVANKSQPVQPATEALKVQPADVVTQKVVAPVKLVKGPVLRDREMTEEECEATVKCLQAPGTLYILPTTSQELYNSIREMAQTSTVEGEVDPVPDTVCLARDPEDGLFYRAQILEVNQNNRVSLFLIDKGKMMEEDNKLLKPMPEGLAQEAGLLIKVSLRGIINQDTWTEQHLDFVNTILDVGGQTIFKFSEAKFIDGKWFVNSVDEEDNDLASLMIESEVSAAENRLSGSALTQAVLQAGKQELLVLASFSPMEMYVTTMSLFEEFSDIPTRKIDEIGKLSDYVHLCQEGDLVLAFRENVWNRAKILDPNTLTVQFIDYPEIVQMEKKLLRKATKEVLEFPVLVAKCGLAAFYGRQEEALMVEKLQDLQLDYKPVEGEVLDLKDGLTKVSIPSVESHLLPAEPASKNSRASILQKLKKK